MTRAHFLFLLLLCYPVSVSGFHSRIEEKEFITSLLNKTTANSVPKPNLTITFVLDLSELLEIDERRNIALMRVWFLISYEVPELQWDPNSTNGVKMLYLPPRSFWTPDIVLLEVSGVDYDAYEDQFITADGLVIARSTTATLKISCQLSFLYFPFDQQVSYSKLLIRIKASHSFTIS